MRGVLKLRDGTEFDGLVIGDTQALPFVGEVVFQTAMTGYQEVLTDPSYCQQIVCFTASHIGNVGCNTYDNESSQLHIAGAIMKDVPQLSQANQNYRSESTLNDWLKSHHKSALTEVDTRALTHHLRKFGATDGVVFNPNNQDQVQKAQTLLHHFSGLKGKDLAQSVSCVEAYNFNENLFDLDSNQSTKAPVQSLKVAVMDFGVKFQILRILVSMGFEVRVFPAKTSAQTIFDWGAHGVLLSNGPGDPEPCDYAIETIKELIEREIPIFGICLGCQLLGLSLGGQCLKMKNGHHGANHPVINLENRKVFITSQNHGFCLSEEGLSDDCIITHRSLFDNTIQGIRHKTKPIIGFQGHPEASPGPFEIRVLFKQFFQMMSQTFKTPPLI